MSKGTFLISLSLQMTEPVCPFSPAFMLSAFYIMTIKEFYWSPAWKQCRETYKKSVGGLCEECWKQGKAVPATEVHHIKHLTPQNVKDPSIALNYDNLLALCEQCHDKMHKKDKRYTIDNYGRVLPL